MERNQTEEERYEQEEEMTPLSNHEVCYLECLFLQGKLKRSPREDWCYSVIKKAWVHKHCITLHQTFGNLGFSIDVAEAAAKQMAQAMEKLRW